MTFPVLSSSGISLLVAGMSVVMRSPLTFEVADLARFLREVPDDR